ncbi:hypothetical protein [Breoghania sp.]|uniref:hypothetical protein n=1 Tax=Breoghania sp. TaxID=2065378 RepID=UPI002AA631E6|nr:hypothetical protein [Breoghania sp.]
MAFRTSTLALCLAVLTSLASPVLAQGMDGLTPDTAAAEIYGFDQLKGLRNRSKLVFDYRLEGRMMEEPFADEVVLDFTRAGESTDHGYDVAATLFAKGAPREIGPLVASSYNPILLIFFQHDVNQMSRGTGGSSHYFRNVIRHAMGLKGAFSAEDVKTEVAGRTVKARRISFTPFATDAHKAQMSKLMTKRYTVTVSDEVAGGIVALESATPAPPDEPGAGPMLHEIYRLREVQ